MSTVELLDGIRQLEIIRRDVLNATAAIKQRQKDNHTNDSKIS